MMKIAAMMLGALPLLAVSVGYAQTVPAGASGTVQAPGPPPVVPPAQSEQEGPALFTIGNLPVRMWAPVPPPYDANANRNLAADPLYSMTQYP